MVIKKTKKKSLSDSELVKKYESGEIDLEKAVKPFIKPKKPLKKKI